MNRFAVLLWLLSSRATWAHHTKDHMVLSEDVEQVIAATREGGGGDWMLLVWTGVTLIVLLGFVRWWRTRK